MFLKVTLSHYVKRFISYLTKDQLRMDFNNFKMLCDVSFICPTWYFILEAYFILFRQSFISEAYIACNNLYFVNIVYMFFFLYIYCLHEYV